MNFSFEIDLVSELYGDRCAKRSGQPLLKHIYEGVSLLMANNLAPEIIAGYILHPITQGGHVDKFPRVKESIGYELAMSYAYYANLYLPRDPYPDIRFTEWPRLEGLLEGMPMDVVWMLWADKVQNRADFERYLMTHKDVPNRERLARYFRVWLAYLNSRLEDHHVQ